jgi:hypothetical protein
VIGTLPADVDLPWSPIGPGPLVLCHFRANSNFPVMSPLNNGPGNWGYCDFSGKIVIPPRYSNAKPFDGQFAIVNIGDKQGVIDRTGKWCVNPDYAKVSIAGTDRVIVTPAENQSAGDRFKSEPGGDAFGQLLAKYDFIGMPAVTVEQLMGQCSQEKYGREGELHSPLLAGTARYMNYNITPREWCGNAMVDVQFAVDKNAKVMGWRYSSMDHRDQWIVENVAMVHLKGAKFGPLVPKSEAGEIQKFLDRW